MGSPLCFVFGSTTCVVGGYGCAPVHASHIFGTAVCGAGDAHDEQPSGGTTSRIRRIRTRPRASETMNQRLWWETRFSSRLGKRQPKRISQSLERQNRRSVPLDFRRLMKIQPNATTGGNNCEWAPVLWLSNKDSLETHPESPP